MIEAILLDIDGTLIDNNALHLLAWQRALRRAGAQVDATTILHKLGMGSDKFTADVFGPARREAAEQARTYHGEEYSDKGLIDHAEPLPGAIALLQALKGRHIRTALASSAKPDEAERSLTQLGGPQAVDVLVSSADVATTKPEPDIFAQALEQLGHPAAALVIGDTVYDVVAAQRLGLPCIGVLSGGMERAVLLAAGAAAVYDNAAAIVAHLDTILDQTALQARASRDE